MITWSPEESRLFKVRFGRFEGTLDDVAALRKQIEDENYDFVRMKILNASEDLFAVMDSLGYEYRLLDIHRYYTLDFSKTPVTLPAGSDLRLVRNEGHLKKEIFDLVHQTFTELPMGYFRHPELEKYFPVALQLQNLARYISSEYCDTGNPGRQSWIIEYKDEVAGCSSTDFKGEEAYTTYIGLLPAFRKKSLYSDVIRTMQFLIQKAGCRFCTGSSRLHNLSSQAVFEREGEQYSRHDYVFMLMPKLGIE